jgi:DNA helicase-2/ATP-dependent DNA helicase PcrA
MEEAGTKETARSRIERAIEEERRLAYVGITRAKDELFILSPAYYRGKKVEISRFLLEAFPSVNISNTIPVTTRTKTETVLAWICSSEGCIAWQRITSYEESLLAHKECPICKASMVKGSKEI